MRLSWKERLVVGLGLALICAMLGLAAPLAADAAPTACPGTDVSCQALSDRLDALDADVQTLHADLSTLDTDLNTTSGAPIAGTVALSADDAHRLDLMWWGMWGVLGLVLVLLIAPRWFAAWSFESGKGV